ncbi:MAG: DMT family transporter [Fuerstiella sp.]|nr:DMT family transporter [Fuerstiella sp.]
MATSAPTVTPVSCRISYGPDAALLGVALIWGINIPIMKTGLDQLDPYVFNAIRLTISACVLGTFALREYRQGHRSKPGVTRSRMLTYGIAVSGIYQLLFLLGIDRTTSGNTALIICTVPMWTALLARLFIGEKLLRLAWCGLLVALSGTVIVALQKGDVATGSEYLAGNLCILGAALVWSGATVVSRPMLKSISPLRLSATAAVIALPLHLLFAVGRYRESMSSLQSVDVWLIIAYAGILSSGLALPMWNFGVRHAGAAHAAIIQNLIPLIAIVAAWLTRGESATTAQLFGGGLILSGLVIMRYGRQNHDVTRVAESESTHKGPPPRE